MEPIVYLQSASLSEASENIEVVPVRVNSNFSPNFNWKKLSYTAAMRLVSVALTLAVLSVARQTFAFQTSGNQESHVTNIQRCLQKIGYFHGPVTGQFGPLTKNAVIQFQKANGLAPDGLVGSRTEDLLQSQCQGRSSGSHANGELQLGSTGPSVRRLQQHLQQLGFFNGPITGYFGSETQQAVIRFQKSRGISPIGIVGPATREAIRLSLSQYRPPVTVNPNPPSESEGGDSLQNTLSFGAAGPQVRDLQQNLQQLGYFNLNPTGYFGQTTADAVTRFQQANGITPNGVADSQTLAFISQALGRQNFVGQNPYQNPYQNPPNSQIPIDQNTVGQNASCLTGDSNICVGERSQRVTAVQQRLQQLGFFSGDASGYYGPETRDAVFQFQRSNGISPTGVVNYQTWQALGIRNFDNSIGSNPNVKNHYVVVVPIRNNNTLYQVQQYIPEAFRAKSRLGDYVNAGQFRDRSDAEKLSQTLRSRGLDARVEYL
jgi:peptidoglycan hydrolase-like protein with peptidoglycan-binding domain